LQENNRRLRYLTKEQCQALINACDAHARPIVIMALNTSMRKGEILKLKWENVDLKNGFNLIHSITLQKIFSANCIHFSKLIKNKIKV
jgi:integrase